METEDGRCRLSIEMLLGPVVQGTFSPDILPLNRMGTGRLRLLSCIDRVAIVLGETFFVWSSGHPSFDHSVFDLAERSSTPGQKDQLSLFLCRLAMWLEAGICCHGHRRLL